MNYYDKNKELLFKKYSDDVLKRDVDSFINGSGRLTKVLNNFFEEEIFKCCGKHTKISPMDCLKSECYMKIILEYIQSKPKFFTGNEIQNVKSCMRNSMSFVRKVANFPPREARDIYTKYFNRGGLIV